MPHHALDGSDLPILSPAVYRYISTRSVCVNSHLESTKLMYDWLHETKKYQFYQKKYYYVGHNIHKEYHYSRDIHPVVCMHIPRRFSLIYLHQLNSGWAFLFWLPHMYTPLGISRKNEPSALLTMPVNKWPKENSSPKQLQIK